MIAPETEITLYKTDIELDNLNQLKFNTWTDQWNYFSSLPKLYLDEATYQRKEGVIRYPNNGIPFDELLRYNYVSYKNSSYSSKTFFAFIKNMRYVNDGMTEIEIETDVYQTWQFDLIYRECFTEREHVKNDNIGVHIQPENVNLGDYVCNKSNEIELMFGKKCIPCMAVTTKPYNPLLGHPDPPLFQPYGGIFSGTKYIISDTVDHFAELLQYYNIMGIQDTAILSIFMIPEYYKSLTTFQEIIIGMESFTWGEIPTTNNSIGGSTAPYDKPSTLDGYTPTNKKLLTYPYIFLNVDNNGGNVTQFHYEDWNSHGYAFNYEHVITPGCSTKIIPAKYKGLNNNYLYSFNACKLPICSYGSDVYTNWLTQNGVNIACDITQNAINTYQGGNPANLFMSVFSKIAQSEHMQSIPNSVKGNLNSGDVVYAMRLQNPICYEMSIKSQNAKIIDDYFTMYGYKVNALKIPEIHSRENWNYVKTVGCNFSGDIPGDDLLKIRSLFDNGITIWHKSKTFLDYSQRNRII